MIKDVFISAHVVVPELALFHVGKRKLPILFRRFDARQEPSFLFFLCHVKEEFQNMDSILNQIVFEVIDLVEPPLPDDFLSRFTRQLLRAEQLWVNTHNEHFFVV